MKFLKTIQLIVMIPILLAVGCKSDQPSNNAGPSITTSSPAHNETGVARNNAIVVTFSTAMDSATINAATFTVKQGTTVVPGVISHTGTTATFTPTNSFVALTTYTVMLTTGVKNAAGASLAANSVWSFTTGGTVSVLGGVNLGSSINYIILAKTAISNGSTSAYTGDLGLSPAATSYITGLALTNATGYATSSQVTGKLYAADMAVPTPVTLTTAVGDMITAYNDAAGRTLPDFVELGTGNIGGKTLAAGLYKWTSTVTVPTAITISGGANDVWIFQIAGNLTVGSAVIVTLSGGAQAKNIFWQVAGNVTLGTTSQFKGVILTMTSVTMQSGSTLNGRALAQTAVTVNSGTVAP